MALNSALKGAFVSAIEDATEVSSENRPKVILRDLHKDAQEGAFEVEIKGVLVVAIKLHFKMDMVVHLLLHKTAQNDSIKR